MKYYVYKLTIIPEGTVCYVGKGSGRRMWNHRKYALRPPKNTQSYLYRKLSGLIASGKDFTPKKIFETNDEQEALRREKELIKHYGIENLFNCSSNHQGPIQEQITEARRIAMSKAGRERANKLRKLYGCAASPEVRAKLSAANKARIIPPEIGAKISAAKSGVPLTAEHRNALSGITRKPRSASAEATRILALQKALCGKSKDLTKARLSRSLSTYAIQSPNGEQWYGFSNGIVKLLKSIGLPISTFYKAVKKGTQANWSVIVSC